MIAEIIKKLLTDLFRKFGITKVSEDMFVYNDLVEKAIEDIDKIGKEE